MSTQRIDVSKDFTVAFDVNLGASDAGADGAAVVFHNDPRGANAIGTIGGGLGVAGIQNGLAIEFDTYNNNAAGQTGPDIASRPHRFPRHQHRLRHHAGGPAQYRGRRVASRRCHLECGDADDELHLRWPAQGTPLTGNIATQFLGGSNFAHVGFGAGTGGLSNTQSVRNINIAATLEGQAPGNSPPIAVADTATTAAGTAVNIAVLANDSDPDNNPLTITTVSNVVGGTTTINARQDDHLYPQPGLHRFWRLFLFDLRRNDGEFPALVSVTVTRRSRRPVPLR